MEVPKIEDMKYGLIVVDKRELEKSDDGNVTILHFCGYWKEPTQNEINVLHQELSESPEFGLTDIMEHVGIYTAPESIVKEYIDEILAGEISPIIPDTNGISTD